MTERNIERELAEKWMKAAVEYGDQAKGLSEQLLKWQEHFLNFGNHKFDCAGNDGTVCECGYLQLWQTAFDACNPEAFTPSGADCHPESPHASTFKVKP